MPREDGDDGQDDEFVVDVISNEGWLWDDRWSGSISGETELKNQKKCILSADWDSVGYLNKNLNIKTFVTDYKLKML